MRGSKPGDSRTTGKPAYPGVNTVSRRLPDGTVERRYYHRATKTRLPGSPGEATFDAAYWQAERVAKAGTAVVSPSAPPIWQEIAHQYQASEDYRRLALKVRADEDRRIRTLIDRFGWMIQADLEARSCRGRFLALRDEIAASGRMHLADQTSAQIAKLLNFAYDRGLIDVNHGLKLKSVSRRKARADIIHTPEMRDAFLAAASPDVRAAYLIALFTAARVDDMIRWTPTNCRNGWLTWKPSKTEKKTGVVVHLPVFALPPLAGALATLPVGQKRLLSHVCGRTGAWIPWSYTSLYRFWRATAKRAGFGDADLHWHDLRGTLVSMLGEASCTDSEIASITGHALGGESEIGSYMRRSPELALSAYSKLARHLESPSSERSNVLRFPA